MKTLPLLTAFCFTLLTVTPAAASTPQGTRIVGTIQKVDAGAQDVELLEEDTRTPITFVWNRLTTFVTGRSMTDAAILKNGARVEVIRHRPFFGRPFVAKVTLLPTNKRK